MPAVLRCARRSASYGSSCAGTSNRSRPTSGASTRQFSVWPTLSDARRPERRLDEAAEASGALRPERAEREVEERLTRLERRERPALRRPRPVARAAGRRRRSRTTSPSRAGVRGSTERVRERQRAVRGRLPRRGARARRRLRPRRAPRAAPRAGVEARGVDADGDMVAYARGEGLDVEQADVVAYLESLPDGSLGGIFWAQVVEHLPPPTLVRTARARAREAPRRRRARRRDDQPALAARAAQLLRRPDACAAARPRDARAARPAGRLRVGRDALPERADERPSSRRPGDRREVAAERAAVRAARLRDPRAHDEDRWSARRRCRSRVAAPRYSRSA